LTEEHTSPSRHIPRKKKIFSIYPSIMSHFIDSKPSCHGEARGEHVWKYAMIEEYQYLLKNGVLDIVQRPYGKSMVTSKWIYKIKHGTDGSVEKHKVRFVARGFSQTKGVVYDETLDPVILIHFHLYYHP
jgi:hypothetical protein